MLFVSRWCICSIYSKLLLCSIGCDLWPLTSALYLRDLNSLVRTPNCAHCCQMQPRSKALENTCLSLDRILLAFIPPSAVGERVEGGEKERKGKERHTERQLPQLLAGVLIKTKLVSLSEQTWQALRLRSFFQSCQDVKWVQVPQECQRLARGRDRSDLSLSFNCVSITSSLTLHLHVYVLV